MGDVAVDTGQKAIPGTMFDKLSVNAKTGEATIVTTTENLEKAQQAMSFMDNAMVEMQKEGDRIAAREQQARSRNPVLAALSSVASHLAEQPDMPGFVRGLGAANREMNPDPDRLAMQKLPIYMQVAKLAQEKAGIYHQNAQLQQQSTIAQQNADSNAIYRRQMALSADENAQTRTEKQMVEASKAAPLTVEQVRQRLGKGADEGIVQSWVQQSKQIHDQARADQEVQNENRLAQRQERQSRARLEDERVGLVKAQAKLATARATLTPQLGAARIRELDEKAFQLQQSGLYSAAQIADHATRLDMDIKKFKNAQSDREVRELGNILLLNPLAPASSIAEVRKKFDERKIDTDVKVVQPAPVPRGAGGLPAPANASPATPTYAKDPQTGRRTHVLSADGTSWIPL